MFGLIKQVFIVLLSFSRSLAIIVNAPGHRNCIPLNKQQSMTQPTLINLHPHNLHHPFTVSLDRCI